MRSAERGRRQGLPSKGNHRKYLVDCGGSGWGQLEVQTGPSGGEEVYGGLEGSAPSLPPPARHRASTHLHPGSKASSTHGQHAQHVRPPFTCRSVYDGPK
jgi:hypothetical protein